MECDNLVNGRKIGRIDIWDEHVPSGIRHSCCVKRLEFQSWRRCIQELKRHLLALLQLRDKQRGLRPLGFACYNDLVLANTLGKHKASREDGHGTAQMEDTITRLIISWLGGAKTRRFQEADIRSDHELVVMTFRLRLKKIKMQGPTKTKFDLRWRRNGRTN